MKFFTRGSSRGMGAFALVSLAALFFLFFRASPTLAESQFKKGSFPKNTALGTQAITGVGFRPKAVIFFWTRQDVGDTFQPNIQTGYSFATGPSNERLAALASDDGGIIGDTRKVQSASSVIQLITDGGTGNVGAQAELTSLDGDGFTINWTVNEARADIIHYIALGGSDLVNAKADSFTKLTGTGNQSVTGVGFKPDFLMFLAIHSTAPEANTTEGQMAIGFVSSPTEEATVAAQLEDGANNTCVYQRTDRMLVELADVGCAEETRFNFISFDTDGFTFDREVNLNDTRTVHYLALQGGKYKVGSFNKDASGLPVIQSVPGVGFPSVGVMLASKNLPANPVVESQGRISFGASDGMTAGATWWHHVDPGAPDANELTSTARVAVHATSPATLNSEADLYSLDSNGFTLDWTTNSAVADEILYVAFGTSTNFRSIGTALDYTTGTVNLTKGSRVVSGSGGTAWKTANRGRGDRIQIGATDYTIFSVDSEAQLTLTTPFQGASGVSAYTISRQYATLAAWEDCIDGGPCAFFPVASADLVADNRSEVGVAYKDSVFSLTASVQFQGTTTDANHTITLTVDSGNRHSGIACSPGSCVVLDGGGTTSDCFQVDDDFITIEWLEIRAFVDKALQINTQDANNRIVLRNNIIHDLGSNGIRFSDPDTIADVYTNIIYNAGNEGIAMNTTGPWSASSLVRILNNTIYGSQGGGIESFEASNGTVLLRNNISHSNVGGDFVVPGLNAASSNNLSSDASATAHSPAGGGIDNVDNGNGTINFVSTTPGSEDLHIQTGSAAENAGADLSAIFAFDIDGGGRVLPPDVNWDIGADEISATTAVELVSFTAVGREASVVLEWETASELNNLGFHLYRAISAEGPFQRITARAIPGLGSSPVGARYRYTDQGLVNGKIYFYRLEVIETTGRTELHGPVTAMPQPGMTTDKESSLITQGDPPGVSLRVLEKTRTHALLELTTPGFTARPQPDGSVRLELPGFVEEQAAGAPALPVKRVSLDAVVGRQVRIASVRETDVVRFSSLQPMAAGTSEVVANRSGIVQARRRSAGSLQDQSLYPEEAARVVSVGFQGEQKKALVELAPLRWDPAAGELRLARKLTVRVAFRGRELDERSADGRRGRHHLEQDNHRNRDGVLSRLVTRKRGLYAVGYEEVFGRSSRRSLPATSLRLSRQGETVAYHLEPNANSLTPGSRLYFFSEGERANPYGREAVYELEVASKGETMSVTAGSAHGVPARVYLERLEREENRYYQAGLIEAPDLWLWEVVFAPEKKSFSFQANHRAPEGGHAQLEVWLQGVSDLPPSPDHHVRLYVNGTLLQEASWDGKATLKLDAELGTALLREGENTLELENVGDTEAAYSMVMLDRFVLTYPRTTLAENGRLEGSFRESGAAEIQQVGADALVLDLTQKQPRWVTVTTSGSDGSLRFRVEADHHYLVVGPNALLHPELRRPSSSGLRNSGNSADYLVVGPRELLPAAQPLLHLRQSQGLRVKAVSLEEVYDQFGFGEPRPDAIRDFLAFAYHHWRSPSLSYVLLLGDATYDFKDYLGTGVKNLLPPLMVKTSYLWTTSDPTYAAVNGEDKIPDLAIGRLPAASLEQARNMVEKILDYEKAEAALTAHAVLVADNPDAAGDFVSDAEEIASLLSPTADLRKIYLSSLGVDASRTAIQNAFDQGASLMSYLGHGGIHLWASENLFDSSRVGSLSPQPQQPFVLTLNCLNGYYHFPYFNSLAEELLKAEDKGAIAAFSPSGMSLNGPAHLFHKALLRELGGGAHQRLGDAVLAAQAAYVEAGAFPELLSIYHLLGDPALTLR